METFEQTIKSFFNEIFALQTSMPLSASVFTTLYYANNKKYVNYLKEKCVLLEEIDESSSKFQIPEEELLRYRKYKQNLDDLNTAKNILPRMYIVTLLCQYDAYVGNLMKLVLTTQPNILNSSERKLTFEEITRFENIDKAKTYLIDKEIESVLRKSHNDHISWFESKLSVSLRSDLALICRFLEIAERRNLFTHNNGIVNDTYLRNCKGFGCSITEIHEGEALKVTPQYFDLAVDTLLEISIKMGWIIWRKMDGMKLEDTEFVINNLAYELIKKGNYSLAINIITFAISSIKRFTSSACRLMLIINLAQSYKWTENEEKMRSLLDEQDWSLCTPDYLIAKNVLLENYVVALELLKETSCIDKESLIEWPLFNKFRKTQEFSDFFISKYGKSIEEVITDLSPDMVKTKFTIVDGDKDIE